MIKKTLRFWSYRLFGFVAFLSLALWPLVAIGLLIAYGLRLLSWQSVLGKLGFTARGSASVRFKTKSDLKRVNDDSPRRTLWIHVASFGEWNTLSQFVAELQRLNQKKERSKKDKSPFRLEIVLSTVNDDLMRHVQTVGMPKGVSKLFFFPLENPIAIRSIVAKHRVEAVVMAEMELWPLSVLALHSLGVKLFMVNACLFRRETDIYRVFAWLFRPTLRSFTQIYPASLRSFENFKLFNVEDARLSEPGSFKIDIALAAQKVSRGKTIDATKKRFKDSLGKHALAKNGKAKKTVILYASFHPQEIPFLQAYFQQARQDSVLSASLVHIVAPRYFLATAAQKWDKLLRSLNAQGFETAKRSSTSIVEPHTQVLLLDSFGELAGLFSLADVVVMGGSFIPYGGHNLLEPLAAGKRVVTGAHVHHFLDVVENFSSHIDLLVGNQKQCAGQFNQLVKTKLENSDQENLSKLSRKKGRSYAGKTLQPQLNKENEELKDKMVKMRGASQRVAADVYAKIFL